MLEKSDYRIMEDWRDYLLKVIDSPDYNYRPFTGKRKYFVNAKKRINVGVELGRVNNWLIHNRHLETINEKDLTIGNIIFYNKRGPEL